MSRLPCAFFALVAVAFLSSCVGTSYTLAKVEIDPSKHEVLGTGEGGSTGVHLFGIIPIGLNDKIERAVERAIADQGGDDLVDVTVEESWFWAYILNGYKVKVSGTVVKNKG